jgi:hypothetical protein
VTTISETYRNAVVGMLKYVDHAGVILVDCDNVFDNVVTTHIVDNPSEAMFLVDCNVCVYGGRVYKLEVEQ